MHEERARNFEAERSEKRSTSEEAETMSNTLGQRSEGKGCDGSMKRVERNRRKEMRGDYDLMTLVKACRRTQTWHSE
eukprot:5913580-Pleurochrysis_carterae.AAC.1